MKKIIKIKEDDIIDNLLQVSDLVTDTRVLKGRYRENRNKFISSDVGLDFKIIVPIPLDFTNSKLGNLLKAVGTAIVELNNRHNQTTVFSNNKIELVIHIQNPNTH